MQNPIFNLAKSLQNQSNQGNQNMMNNSMNTGMNPMGMNMNQMPNMQNMPNMQMSGMNQMPNMMNPQMNMGNNMGMSGMNQMQNMMNPQMIMGNNMGMMDQANAMNMNFNNNMNMGNMNSNTPAQQSNQLSVYFRAGNNGENGSIMIQCTVNDKVSDLIAKYRAKSLEDVSQKKFVFNAKALNPNLTVAEAGINDGANIFVVNTAGVKGA